MAESQDAVLTIDQLAKYLKLSKSTLYHLARRGEVPGQKIGRHWRFHKAAIDSWLGNRDVPQASELSGNQASD